LPLQQPQVRLLQLGNHQKQTAVLGATTNSGSLIARLKELQFHTGRNQGDDIAGKKVTITSD
jgi:hypothetical protein